MRLHALAAAAALWCTPALAQDWRLAGIDASDPVPVVRFLWRGEGAPELDAVPFAAICAEVVTFYEGLADVTGGAMPESVIIEVRVETGRTIRISRSYSRGFEVMGGQCLGDGAEVDL